MGSLALRLSVEYGQIKSIAKRSESETSMCISLFLSLFLPLQLAVFPRNDPSPMRRPSRALDYLSSFPVIPRFCLLAPLPLGWYSSWVAKHKVPQHPLLVPLVYLHFYKLLCTFIKSSPSLSWERATWILPRLWVTLLLKWSKFFPIKPSLKSKAHSASWMAVMAARWGLFLRSCGMRNALEQTKSMWTQMGTLKSINMHKRHGASVHFNPQWLFWSK